MMSRQVVPTGIDHPVHFSRSAPFQVDCDQLIFYDVIERSFVSRSSVLACVAEAGGKAKLPDSITVSDFKQWLAAATDSDLHFRSRSFTCKCTVIKVADVIDDKNLDEWVHIAAKELIKNALCWSTDTANADGPEGLYLLTAQLQHRLFAEAVSDPTTLDPFLAFIPTCLHTAVLMAMITPEKTLQMPLDFTTAPALKALASLPASPPPVLSLQLDDDNARCTGEDVGPDVWSGLSQALHRHSHLTSLLLSPSHITDISEEHPFPAIATLTTLRSLELKGCTIYPEESSTILKPTLQALPHLLHLKLRLDEPPDRSRRKRRRFLREQAAKQPPPYCLAAMLSAATGLTSLHLHVYQCIQPDDQCDFTASAPLHMPQLVRLTAIFNNDLQLGTAFFRHLTAPLTSLALGEDLDYDHYSLPAKCADHAGHLLHSLAAFTQLRRLSVVLPVDDDHASLLLWRVVMTPRPCEVSIAHCVALPPLLAALRRLESLSVSAIPFVAERAAFALSAPTLTQLHLRTLDLYHGLPPEALLHLIHFRLLDLSLEIQAKGEPPHGLATLSALTHLTALSLRGWSCLRDPADWQALAAMTRLQRLCFVHTGDGFAVPAACVASMHALSGLTALTTVSSAADERLVPHLAERPLPVLQELALALHDPYRAVGELGSYTASLPALRRLSVKLYPPPGVDRVTTHSCLQADSDAAAERRLVSAERSLTEAVALSGVALSVDYDWFVCQ